MLNNQNGELNQNNFLNNNNNLQNNEENNDNIQYKFSRYTNPIKTGLINFGDTSYFNAVLFSLGNIRFLSSYFLNPKNQNIINQNISEMPFSYAYERLLIHFYPFNEKDEVGKYDPSSIFNLLGQHNIVYKSFKRRNPNDLLCFILNILHSELKVQKSKPKLNGNITNKNQIIKYGFENFKNFNDSIISKIFNWFEIKESICNKCNQSIYDFQTFNTFSLDIYSTYQYQKNKDDDLEYLTIYDCLDFFGFGKQNNLYCNNCKKSLNKIHTSRIFSSPKIFIFLIERGVDFDKNNTLISIPFHLYDKIDLFNFVDNSKVPQKYGLIGVVSIYMKYNKYVSFCMSPVNNQWYFYNDENIEQTDISSVLQKHNNYKEFIPSILFYESINI